MKKALVLVIGAAIYVYFMQTGQDVATRALTHVENLYTSANGQAAAIAASNR